MRFKWVSVHQYHGRYRVTCACMRWPADRWRFYHISYRMATQFLSHFHPRFCLVVHSEALALPCLCVSQQQAPLLGPGTALTNDETMPRRYNQPPAPASARAPITQVVAPAGCRWPGCAKTVCSRSNYCNVRMYNAPSGHTTRLYIKL